MTGPSRQRTLVPALDERIWRRSQKWLAIQRPRPPGLSRDGRSRPTRGSEMVPASATSQTTCSSSCQARRTPLPPPWRSELVTTLIDGEDEPVGPLGVDHLPRGPVGHEPARRPEIVGGVERKLVGLGGRVGQRTDRRAPRPPPARHRGSTRAVSRGRRSADGSRLPLEGRQAAACACRMRIRNHASGPSSKARLSSDS